MPKRLFSRRAFTLVELLVVIGIIAVLISILLPTLGRVRRSASTLVCQSNVRSILQGMQIYASQNSGYFPGGAHTSARFMFLNARSFPRVNNPAINDNNCPSVTQIFDWASPIAKALGLKFNEGPTLADRRERFLYLNNYPGFVCPENTLVATEFTGASAFLGTVTAPPSYNTSTIFHFVRQPVPAPPGASTNSTTSGATVTHARTEFNVPSGYIPKLTEVGNSAQKVYIYCGARFSTTNEASGRPSINFSFNGSNGGAWSDQGAWTRFSRSLDRGRVPGNAPEQGGTFDARMYGFRHGTRQQGAPADAFKGVFGFFDGHVEVLGDLEAANPILWAPRGTGLVADTGQTHADAFRRYYNNTVYTTTNPFIVP